MQTYTIVVEVVVEFSRVGEIWRKTTFSKLDFLSGVMFGQNPHFWVFPSLFWLVRGMRVFTIYCLAERIYQIRCSIVVSISACHTEDPGSIPGGGIL